MPWITLTSDHLNQSLAEPERTALSTLLLNAGQTDPVPDILDRTTLEARGYIAAYHGHQVGQPGTIPSELLSACIAIARWRVLGRLPVKIFATESRRKEYEDAVALLRDVAAGKFLVAIPDDPDPEQPLPPADGAWGSATNIFTPPT